MRKPVVTRVTAEQWRWVEHRAADADCPAQEIVEDALRAWLERPTPVEPGQDGATRQVCARLPKTIRDAVGAEAKRLGVSRAKVFRAAIAAARRH